MAFGNVAWDRHRRSAHLRNKSVGLHLGKGLSAGVHSDYQFHRFLPGNKVAVGPHGHLYVRHESHYALSEVGENVTNNTDETIFPKMECHCIRDRIKRRQRLTGPWPLTSSPCPLASRNFPLASSQPPSARSPDETALPRWHAFCAATP